MTFFMCLANFAFTFIMPVSMFILNINLSDVLFVYVSHCGCFLSDFKRNAKRYFSCLVPNVGRQRSCYGSMWCMGSYHSPSSTEK